MLEVTLEEPAGIAILRPHGALSKSDFEHAASLIDPLIEKTGKLNGLIIQVPSFPGWDSFAGFMAHMKFVRNHHARLTHLAFVTDSPIGNLAEHLAGHFIKAEIRAFPHEGLEEAKRWVAGEGKS